MLGIVSSIHILNPLGLCLLLFLWIVLSRCTHVLVMVIKHEPLIGWGIGPLGVTVMAVHEPATWYIWFTVACPALVSSTILYVGLFTELSPIALPYPPVTQVVILVCGVILASSGDIINALRDLRYPLWGEARILRNMRWLRATSARIHFTPFGYTYLIDHFHTNPTELLQTL